MTDAPAPQTVLVPVSGPVYEGAILAAIHALGLPSWIVPMATAQANAHTAINAALAYVKANSK